MQQKRIRKVEARSRANPCRNCPLASAVRIIERVTEEKIKCAQQLQLFIDALKEADRRLQGVISSGTIQ